MKVQNILIDKMIIFFNADIITLYIKELRLLGKIHAHARHFFLFKERVCYIYNHRFRYLTLYIQTTHTLHLFTERGTTDYTDWHRGAQRRILRYVLSDRYSRKQKDDTHGHTQK